MSLDSLTTPARHALREAAKAAHADGRPAEATDVVRWLAATPDAVAGELLNEFGLQPSEPLPPSSRQKEEDIQDPFCCLLTLESFADAFRQGNLHVCTVSLLETLMRLDPIAVPSFGLDPELVSSALLRASRSEPRREVVAVGDGYREAIGRIMEMDWLAGADREAALTYWRANLRAIADAAAQAAHSATGIGRRDAFNAAYVHAADQVFARVRAIAGLET